MNYALLVDGRRESIDLPPPDVHIIPGLVWGHPGQFLSPAFWAMTARFDAEWKDGFGEIEGIGPEEQTVFCLLGGHSITYEMNAAAFEALCEARSRSVVPDAAAIEDILRQPMCVGGKLLRYRFPATKARFVAHALQRFATEMAPTEAFALRRWLLELRGVGPKTASWIVRNYLDSDAVAILDIHLYRAGLLTGFFAASDRIDRDYFQLEQKFLKFAHALGVRPSRLDAVMWATMRSAPTAVKILMQEMREGVPIGRRLPEPAVA